MRTLAGLILGLAVLVVGCGNDDESPTQNGGTNGLSGIVLNLLFEGTPVPGVVVTSGGAADVSGANGSFTLPGVSAPYNLLAIVPDVPDGSLFFVGQVGGTSVPARIGAVGAGWNNARMARDIARGAQNPSREYSNDSADLAGNVTNADPASGPIVVAIGDGERANDTLIFDPSSPSYSGGFLWMSAPTHTVDVAALQLDSGGDFRYGRTDGIVLIRASMGNANIALNVVAGGTGQIPVSASPPTGFTFANPEWTAYVVVDGLPLEASNLNADAGNLLVPIIPNATYIALFEANLRVAAQTRGFYAFADPEAMVGTAVNIVAEAPPVLTTPADAATSVPLIPTFEFTPPPSADRNVLNAFGFDPYGEVSQQWIVLTPGTTTSVPLPASAALRAQLNPSSDYDWSVISVFDEAGTLDGANMLMWLSIFFNPGTDVSLATTGRKARVDASTLPFTTALE